MKTKPNSWSKKRNKKRKDSIAAKMKAYELRALGFSYAEIARRLHRYDTIIYYWLRPDYRKLQNASTRKWIHTEYHTNEKFRRKLIDANTKHIIQKYKVCKTFRDNKRKYNTTHYRQTRTSKKPYRPYNKVLKTKLTKEI